MSYDLLLDRPSRDIYLKRRQLPPAEVVQAVPVPSRLPRPPRMTTFQRASLAMYLDADTRRYRQAAANVPRYEGVAPPANNKLLAPENLGAANWSKLNVTTEADATVAPDNTLTADLVRTTVAATAAINQSSAGNTGAHVLSLYLKADTVNSATVGLRNITGNAWFTSGVTFAVIEGPGAIAGIGANSVANVTGLSATEWTRVSVAVSTIAGPLTIGPLVYPRSNAIGTVGDSVAVWGAQLEEGTTATPYVPATPTVLVMEEAATAVGWPSRPTVGHATYYTTADAAAFVESQPGRKYTRILAGTPSFGFGGSSGTVSPVADQVATQQLIVEMDPANTEAATTAWGVVFYRVTGSPAPFAQFYFNLSTGAITSVIAPAGTSYSVTKLTETGPNGGRVYLLKLTATLPAGDGYASYVYLAGNVGQTGIAHHRQFELTEVGTSPILTISTAVQRAADAATELVALPGDRYTADLLLVSGAERIRQQIEVTLRAFLGEWFLDTSFGVPYLEEITVKNPRMSAVQTIMRTHVADVPGVLRVRSVELEINRPARMLFVTIEAETTEGIVGPFDFSLTLTRGY